MAVQFNPIQQSASGGFLSKLGKVVGAIGGGVVGAVTGGPGGAIAGASGGANLGGMLGGIGAKGAKEGPMMQQPSNGVQQRLEQLRNDDLTKLAQAKAALPELPDNIRAQYEAPINEAFNTLYKQRVG